MGSGRKAAKERAISRKEEKVIAVGGAVFFLVRETTARRARTREKERKVRKALRVRAKTKARTNRNLRSRISMKVAVAMFAEFVAVEATGEMNALRDLVAL